MNKKLKKQKEMFRAGWRTFQIVWRVSKSKMLLMIFSALATSVIPFVLAWIFNNIINLTVDIAGGEAEGSDLFLMNPILNLRVKRSDTRRWR